MDSASPISSIHRLSRDVWAQIAAQLLDNDLIHLLMTGSPPFTRLVKAGSKRLSLHWKIIDYLDLYRIFNSHRKVKCEELIIRSFFAGQLVWRSPSTLVMWPSTLARLELLFNGAIELILNQGPLNAVWPSLKVLKLCEEVKDERPMSSAPLSLRDLPHELLELHLSSLRRMYCIESDMANLPTSLRTLTLDLAVQPWLPTDADKSSLPRLGPISQRFIAVDGILPPNLESLALRFHGGRPTVGWDLISLPSSLQRLAIFGTRYHIRKTISISSMIAALPYIDTLSIPDHYLSPQQLEQIPPTITTLSCSIDALNVATTPLHVIASLKHLMGDLALQNALFSTKQPFFLANLTDLNMITSDFNVFPIPPALTRLKCSAVAAYSMPATLTSLSCIKVEENHNDGLYPWFLPPQLRMFEAYPVGAHFSRTRLMESIPPSLEEVHVLTLNDLVLIKDRWDQGLLPNLNCLELNHVISVDSLRLIPLTLRTLNITLSSHNALLVPLDNLPNFSISKLQLLYICAHAHPDFWTHLTEHWPRGLTDLHLTFRPCIPSLNFKWPNALRRLELKMEEAPGLLPPLPAGVHTVNFNSVPNANLALDEALLPPFLSEYQTRSVEGNKTYFRSRKSSTDIETGAFFGVDDFRFCASPYR